MIEALAWLAGVGLTALAASTYTRRKILSESEEIAASGAKEVIEELLSNPDTKDDMRRVVRGYVAGRKKLVVDKEGKNIKGLHEEINEFGTPTYDYPYKGVTDSALYDLYHKELDPEAYKKVDRSENEFYDNQEFDPYDSAAFEKWLASYDQVVKA